MNNINIRKIAFKIYKEYHKNIKISEIAKYLNVSPNTVYSWKRRDKWDKRINSKVGAPRGNKNAIGAPTLLFILLRSEEHTSELQSR